MELVVRIFRLENSKGSGRFFYALNLQKKLGGG